MAHKRYTLTPYCGNKANYEPIMGGYDTIIDPFAGSLGGTLKTAIVNPQAKYIVAESSNCQRSLIKGLQFQPDYYDLVKDSAIELVEEFFGAASYSDACKWLSKLYSSTNALLDAAALSVMRRFFFSSILRTTPGSGDINVWISTRKILGDSKWKTELSSMGYSISDYKALSFIEKREFNAAFGEHLFKSKTLKSAMVASIESWHKSIQPLLREWFNEQRNITILDDYKSCLDTNLAQGNTLLYVDPPYYNPNKGTFRDEAGRIRRHKQTPSYENHDPQAIATWLMFYDCYEFGLSKNVDMVLCNYGSTEFTDAIDNLSRNNYDLEVMISEKECLCTGQKSKYTSVPIGTESIYFATPKVEYREIAA